VRTKFHAFVIDSSSRHKLYDLREYEWRFQLRLNLKQKSFDKRTRFDEVWEKMEQVFLRVEIYVLVEYSITCEPFERSVIERDDFFRGGKSNKKKILVIHVITNREFL
jgi:hypothetical protein